MRNEVTCITVRNAREYLKGIYLTVVAARDGDSTFPMIVVDRAKDESIAALAFVDGRDLVGGHLSIDPMALVTYESIIVEWHTEHSVITVVYIHDVWAISTYRSKVVTPYPLVTYKL